MEIIDLIGAVLVAYAVLSVNHKFNNGLDFNQDFFPATRREQFVGVLGVALIAVSYIVKLF